MSNGKEAVVIPLMRRSEVLIRLGCFFVVCCLTAAAPAVAQTQPAGGRFEERVYKDDHGDHKYAVFVPANYKSGQPVPAILFLHGAGERGSDGKKQLTVGLAPYIKARAATFPFLVVFPQCEDLDGQLLAGWSAETSDGQRALKILDEAQATYKTDPKRTVLMGWSMGGYGAWSLGAAQPDRWSAVVALSGGANAEKVSALKETPVWAFHGAKDKLVPIAESRAAVEALKAAGGNVALTEFAKLGHAPFEETFVNDGLIRWMLDPKQARAALTPLPLNAKPLVPPPPFAPALEVPEAVGIRLGNEALHAISYAAPKLVPANLLRGQLNDMFDSTNAAGRQFDVRFSGITYSAQLERAFLKSQGKDRLLVQLGLRNVVMTIGGTTITGARHGAQAGPISIYIGHNGPVWLSLEVTPTVVNRRLTLRYSNSSFTIPPDNFSVSQPAGVSAYGFGMTEDRVAESLTSGLYGSRGRIESEVRSLGPQIARQLEEQLNLVVDAGPLLHGLWPLPVYAPQLRAWPQSVQTDDNGVTLVMGLTAANPDPYLPAKPLKIAKSAGVSLVQLGQGTSLNVALAPEVLAPLTSLLIDENLASINLLDIPEKSFARLSDPAELKALIPDLARHGDNLQTRSVLKLAAPFETNSASETLEFRLPKVLVTVSINTNSDSPDWQSAVEFELEMRQSVEPSLSKPTFARREVQLGWKPDQTIIATGKFADGYAPQDQTLHADKLAELFRDSWTKWTQGESSAGNGVPDITFGPVTLRMNDLKWSAPVLAAGFKPAGIKITNLSDEPFTYEAKGPHSPFGGPYTLKPGDSHDFAIPYPLTYRRREGNRTVVYTLLSGSHSEFRKPKTGGPPQLFQALAP